MGLMAWGQQKAMENLTNSHTFATAAAVAVPVFSVDELMEMRLALRDRVRSLKEYATFSSDARLLQMLSTAEAAMAKLPVL